MSEPLSIATPESVEKHSKGIPALGMEGVTQAYLSRDGSETVALKDLDLQVGRSEFISLVGPSGCGKSTILRLAAGLAKPTLGRVQLNGYPVANQRELVGVVFQKPTLLDWLSVEQNVLLPVRVAHRRIPNRERDRARELLAKVGLEAFADKMPRELSGGMQQRAAICRGLIQDPEVLLMDEPFGALDALTREEMSFELLRIWSETQKTILFVTHSINEAVLLSDRVVVLSPRPGRILEQVEVSLQRPRTTETLTHGEFHDRAQRIRELIYGRGA